MQTLWFLLLITITLRVFPSHQVQLGSGADGPSMSIGVSALELLGDEEEEDEARRDVTGPGFSLTGNGGN